MMSGPQALPPFSAVGQDAESPLRLWALGP